MFKDLIKCLAKYDFEVKQLDYTKYNWDNSKYDFKELDLMQMEFEPKYKYLELNATLLISIKLFEIFKIIISSNQPKLNNILKNTFSLSYLMELNVYAKEIWPLKKVLLNLVNNLYVNDKISIRNLEFIVQELGDHLINDLKAFEAEQREVGLSMNNNILFYSEFETIRDTFIQSSCFSPYRGMIIYNKSTSQSDYIVNSIYWLLRKFLEII